jgi:hypothetical protein
VGRGGQQGEGGGAAPDLLRGDEEAEADGEEELELEGVELREVEAADLGPV